MEYAPSRQHMKEIQALMWCYTASEIRSFIALVVLYLCEVILGLLRYLATL